MKYKALGGIAMSFFYNILLMKLSKKVFFLLRDIMFTKMNTHII